MLETVISSASGALLAANNLSDLVDAATARANLFGAGFSWNSTSKALALGGANPVAQLDLEGWTVTTDGGTLTDGNP